MNRKEFAVIGLGRFGSNLALTLESLGHHVLGIDNDQEITQAHMDGLAQVLTLDTTNEEALRAAGVAHFGTIIVAIGADFESNLLTTVSLKELGATRVISRAQTGRQAKILDSVGADQVVRPEYDAGRRLAQDLDLPGLLDSIVLGPGYQVAEIKTPKSVTNQTLKQSNIRGKFGVTLLVVKRGDDILISPGADLILYPEDLLVVLGADGPVNKFCELP